MIVCCARVVAQAAVAQHALFVNVLKKVRLYARGSSRIQHTQPSMDHGRRSKKPSQAHASRLSVSTTVCNHEPLMRTVSEIHCSMSTGADTHTLTSINNLGIISITTGGCDPVLTSSSSSVSFDSSCTGHYANNARSGPMSVP